jgi:LacI family transcriptional regulator
VGVDNPSLRDIAKLANVSVGTVSNVLNNPAKVSTEMRKRVQTAISQLGFIPEAVKGNSNKNSKLIGLVLPLSNNPFYEEFAQGLEDAVGNSGFRVLIGYSREDESVELQIITAMADADFRAVVVNPVGSKVNRFEKFIDNDIRLAFISQSDDLKNQCSVAIDQVSGGYMGIEFLHSLGHKKILWLSGPKKHHQSIERFVGITQAAKEFDIDLTVMTSPSLDFLSGEHMAPLILDAGPLPDAIFCGNDSTALGVMNYFYKQGIKIPEDVSFLGYDNVSYAESALIPLSTVSQTPFHLGFTMGSQLIEELTGGPGHLHQHLLIKPQIIERASTAKRA